MNSTDIFKQCVINSLITSEDLQYEIKMFLFYDINTAEAIRNKRGLINQLKLGLNYMPAINGHWGLSYRYEIQLQAINCICCGQFLSANNYNAGDLPENMICHCDEEYLYEIMSYI